MAKGGRIKTGMIEVEGLAELNRALKTMDPTLKGELRKTNKTVADFVANDARSAGRSLGGVQAKAAESVKSTAGALSAGVSFGGNAYPFAGGAEFGAAKYKQFPPWRGNGSTAGYFVYPSIRRDADRIETQYKQAMDATLRRTGLK